MAEHRVVAGIAISRFAGPRWSGPLIQIDNSSVTLDGAKEVAKALLALAEGTQTQRKLYGYGISPIDFWAAAPSLREYLRSAVDRCGNLFVDQTRSERPDGLGWFPSASIDESRGGADALLDEVRELLALWRRAQKLARAELGWDGDTREGEAEFPCLAVLPSENEMGDYVFTWKHDNNGNTFVVSTIPLPHLVEIAFSEATSEEP